MLFYIVVIIIKMTLSTTISLAYTDNKSVLFIGASHVFWGVDDSVIPSSVNCSAPSERYMFTYLKLKRILDDNHQIKTVFIQCAPTDLWENADDKYFAENEMSYFIPVYFPWFGEEEWNIYSGHLRRVLVLIFQKIISPKQLTYSGIKSQLGGQADRSAMQGSFDRRTVMQKLVMGKCGNDINHRYLRKIINLCSDRGVRLIGLYMPAYKPECMYNQDYFYDVLQTKFPDMEFMDYSHYDVPDSARLDASHLNYKGAQILTGELKGCFHLQ